MHPEGNVIAKCCTMRFYSCLGSLLAGKETMVY